MRLVISLFFLICAAVQIAAADQTPFYFNPGQPQMWMFLISQKASQESDQTVIEGSYWVVVRDTEKMTEQTLTMPFKADCGSNPSVGSYRIRPDHPAPLEINEAVAYSLWREVCTEFIDPMLSPATLVCTEKVPKTVRELGEHAARVPKEGKKAKATAEQLARNYCAIAKEPLRSDGQEEIGASCVMKTGMLRGVRVYWSECAGDKEAQREAISQAKKRFESSHLSDSLQSLMQCCVAYCRAVGCNSPPAATGCSAKYQQWQMSQHGASFQKIYGGDVVFAMKRNYFEGAKAYKGMTISACR
jgi:hypothetical protein